MDLAGISDTSVFTLSAFVRSANNYLRKADTWIWESVGDWQFDDSNFSDTPILTKDAVASDATYRIPATTRYIERVEAKYTDGSYYFIHPIDKSQIKDVGLSEFYKTAGNPLYYDLAGRNITFYPPFSTNRTNGIKLYVGRDIHPFTTADTNAEPGFDNHFHRIVSLGGAFDESLRNVDRERAGGLEKEIEKLKEELMNFYSKRHRGRKARIRPSVYEAAARL